MMSLRILIVDDSPIIRKVIEKNVRMTDFPVDQCVHAADGQQALDILQEAWIDLVFADINMPVMNGVEMIRRMSDDGMLQTIPVIVASTEGSETRIEELRGYGVTGYLRKPFTPEQFKQAMATALEKKDAA